MPVDLDEVREMLASLHSGPYWWERRGPDGATWTLYAPNTIPGVEPPFNEGHPYNLLNTDASEWDATGEALRALIAAAPELLAQLADECEGLRWENAKLTLVLDQTANILKLRTEANTGERCTGVNCGLCELARVQHVLDECRAALAPAEREET